MSTRPTVAQGLAAALEGLGVRRLFGIPGGGSSLDVIEAAGEKGIEFILARGETSAAIMAMEMREPATSAVPTVIVTVPSGARLRVAEVSPPRLNQNPPATPRPCPSGSGDL